MDDALARVHARDWPPSRMSVAMTPSRARTHRLEDRYGPPAPNDLRARAYTPDGIDVIDGIGPDLRFHQPCPLTGLTGLVTGLQPSNPVNPVTPSPNPVTNPVKAKAQVTANPVNHIKEICV